MFLTSIAGALEGVGRELLRQERGERRGTHLGRIIGVDEDHFHRGAELAEHLPAGAAGGMAAAGDDGDGDDLLVPRGDGRADGDALGADRQAVGGVLDVAAGEDFAVGGEDRGADLEFRVGGVGVAADCEGGLAQRIVLVEAHNLLAERICVDHNSRVAFPAEAVAHSNITYMRTMRHLANITVGTAICMIVSSLPTAGMAASVDVSQLVYQGVGDISRGDRSGQTFTPTRDGLLAGIRLLVQGGTWGPTYPAGSDATIRLRELGSNGVPLESAVAVGRYFRTDVDRSQPKWIDVLFDVPYRQTASVPLAFMIEDATSGSEGWSNFGMQNGNPYAGGQMFHLNWSDPFATTNLTTNIYDFAFETLVVPEPVTCGMTATAFFIAASLRAKPKKRSLNSTRSSL